ncbi:energy transducer TonB [Hymenobacter tibetensis]|uniref:Energy transducer TonB n=1 Tax=Hymenobacter tibetensis TaxID=497967 RepID=A0ABY4CUV6_9BACT|nr:energy transducer TonB [Hymenobacter tibetensis]UOG72794.1 energy transducer TonB [Hymenobacter tibetensis]
MANAAEVPSLRRGIGQRMKEGQMIAEDIRHHEYMSKSFHYPSEALRAETEGRITLRLAVNPTGQVVSITSTENTIPAGAVGRENMVQQVYFLMRQLKFEPAATTTDEEFVFTYKYE